MAVKSLPKEELMRPGGGGCPGCPSSLALRIALKALGSNTVLVMPACCAVVCVGPYPKSSIDVPVVSIAFEAAAAAAAGIVSGYKRKGKEDANVVVWAGDGGTYDIGLHLLQQRDVLEHRHPAQWRNTFRRVDYYHLDGQE